MKKLFAAVAGMALSIASPAIADDDAVSVSISADYVTEYVFRGASFARGAFQPGIEASTGGFTAGAWFSEPLGDLADAAGSELNLYGSYGFDLTDGVSATVGGTLYHFPDADGGVFDFGDASTFEVYAGVGFDTVLEPSVTAYYDLDLEAFTLEGGVSHSLPVAESLSLDLGATAGLVTADGGGDYEYAQGSAALSYAVSDATSAYIGANFGLSSVDSLQLKLANDGSAFTARDNLVWFGAGVSTGF